MSSRKSSRLQLSDETASIRRSGRVRRSVVFTTCASDSSESEKNVPRKKSIGRCSNKKKRPLAVEQDQQIQEPTLGTNSSEIPPGETIDGIPVVEIPSSPEEEKANMWRSNPGIRIPVVEIPSSPEEEKANCDFLFTCKHASEPNPLEECLVEDRQHLVNAASVLKSKLVARLTSSADNLRTKDMINLASRCYIALRELGDDYISFSSQVNKLIAQHQELEFAAKDMENWNDQDLEARFIQQSQFLYEVTEKLFSAQDKLSRTKTQVELLLLKKEELTAMLLMLTEELSEEEERVKTLTAERNQFQKWHSEIKVGLEKLGAEKDEASVAFKATNACYNDAKEELERITNHLLQSIRRPSRPAASVGFSPYQTAKPSTTSFSTAKLATLPSTGLFQGNKGPEDQTSAPAIGVSSEITSPSLSAT